MANEFSPTSRFVEQEMESASEISERRAEERFPLAVVVILQELSHTRKTPLAKTSARGFIRNVSNGGIGLTTSAPLPHAAVVRCDINLKDVAVSIPTMAQVRWVQRDHSGQYRCGLAYLL